MDTGQSQRTEKSGSWFERNPKKTITTFFLLLFSLVDFLFSMNILIMDKERLYRIRSYIYHHDLSPNKNIKRVQWGRKFYSVNTNSLGFRDLMIREIYLDSKYYRILFIGDSFSEGIGVDYENSFVGIIQNSLIEKGIEVLNASVASYSPIIYLTKIKHIIENVRLKFDELIVFIDISDIYDEAIYYIFDENHHVVDNNAMIKKEDEKGYNNCSHIGKEKLFDLYLRKIKKFTILTRTILETIENFFINPSPFFRKNNCSTNLRRAMWTLDKDIYEEYGKLGLERSKEHLSSLLNILNKNSVKLSIAIYPWPDQIINHDINSKQVSFWKEWAISNEVTFLNYFPYFIGRINNEEILKEYFIPGDVHWNENGHKLVANIFLGLYKNGK